MAGGLGGGAADAGLYFGGALGGAGRRWGVAGGGELAGMTGEFVGRRRARRQHRGAGEWPQECPEKRTLKGVLYLSLTLQSRSGGGRGA